MTGYLYLATPYSKFPGGIEAAFKMACRATARLIRAGIPVFSPIAHCHSVAYHGCIDPLDHKIWLPADLPLMMAATGLIVYRAESWAQSFGIGEEIKVFEADRKPVLYLDPGPIPDSFIREVQGYSRDPVMRRVE